MIKPTDAQIAQAHDDFWILCKDTTVTKSWVNIYAELLATREQLDLLKKTLETDPWKEHLAKIP